jgi:class 3 adenylate cyclase/TolB-like protein/Flp pilus assembly protein TadD
MTTSAAPADTGPPSASTDEALFADLPRRQKVVLVMDLVESVRLMAANEAAVVQRWHAFVQHARGHVLPRHHGRHVKSLGDGLLAEFDSAPEAVSAAHELHHFFDDSNAALAPEQRFHLRAGLNAAQIYVDAIDIYGAGVNLAARVASLAGPGETIVTTEVRDDLTDGLDGELRDMGECYLKHVPEPIRVWRVGDAGAQPLLTPASEQPGTLLPGIAVIPFAARNSEPEHLAVGELVADAVISLLGRSPHLRVISRLSCSAFRQRDAALGEVSQRLGAQFVLSGSYVVLGSAGGGKLLITVELCDARSGMLMWTERFNAEVGDLLQAESECAHRIALAASSAILNAETDKARVQPVATLSAYSLQLSAINLMHRSPVADFEKGRELLLALGERQPRASEVRAWLAKWHVLRVIRGISANPADDARHAMDACRQALDLAPENPLALAVRGYALSQVMGNQEWAQRDIDHALALAPNEVHAWLYRSVWNGHIGQSAEAVRSALKARALSPLDPHAYFLETILASAYTSNRQYEKAIESASASLRLDRSHPPSLRTLLLSQYESGDTDSARATLARLLEATPGLSIQSYMNMGNALSPVRKRAVEAFRALGLPDRA